MTESLHSLSGAYVVDALDDFDRAAFEHHLAGCLDCQAEVASLREATALMADDAALTPPSSLRESVLAGIKTVRPLPPLQDPVASPAEPVLPAPVTNVVPMRPRRRMTSLVAAAAAVVAIGAGAVWQPWQDDTSSSTLSAADQVLAASDAEQYSIKFDDGATATVVRSLKEGQAVLVTRNMAAPPPGKAFQLWLQDDAGAMIPAGLMKRPGDQKILLQGDATKATGVGITVEPESGSPEPTTEPIALFEMNQAET